MKIIQAIASLLSGGAETVVEQLSIELKRQGHEVIVLVLDNFYEEKVEINRIKNLKENKIDVISLNRKPSSRDIKPFLKLNKIIQKFQPEIIHFHSEIVGFYLIPSLFKSKIIFFQTIHSSSYDNTLISKLLCIKIFKNKINKIYCSYDAKIFLEERFGKGVVIENGIKFQKCINNRDSILSNLKLKKESFLILIVGRIETAKNHILLPEILSILLENNKNIHFIHVGASKNEILLTDLLKKIDELNVGSNFHFLGLRNDVANLMFSVDLFLSTSVFEGLPMTALEAMASGVRMLLSPIKEHCTVFGGKYEVSFPIDHQAKSFADNILMSMFPYSKNNVIIQRQIFIDQYSIEKMTEKHLKTFLNSK